MTIIPPRMQNLIVNTGQEWTHFSNKMYNWIRVPLMAVITTILNDNILYNLGASLDFMAFAAPTALLQLWSSPWSEELLIDNYTDRGTRLSQRQDSESQWPFPWRTTVSVSKRHSGIAYLLRNHIKAPINFATKTRQWISHQQSRYHQGQSAGLFVVTTLLVACWFSGFSWLVFSGFTRLSDSHCKVDCLSPEHFHVNWHAYLWFY